MSNEYLRAFVIGSSCLIFLPFFIAVSQFKKEYFNFDYVSYTIIAPIFLGFMNMFSLYFAKLLNITKQMRFLLTSLIAPTIVILAVMSFNIYNYTKDQWINHIWKTYLLYFIVVNIILFLLDKYV